MKTIFPEGYQGRKPLCFPTSQNVVTQTRQMRIQIGQTIIGREEYEGGWNEVRLTLLWRGKNICVWQVVYRTWKDGYWITHEEAANYTLDCRRWFRFQLK